MVELSDIADGLGLLHFLVTVISLGVLIYNTQLKRAIALTRAFEDSSNGKLDEVLEEVKTMRAEAELPERNEAAKYGKEKLKELEIEKFEANHGIDYFQVVKKLDEVGIKHKGDVKEVEELYLDLLEVIF